MALEALLATLAACLMAWIVQTENGGLLNILFKPDISIIPDKPTFNINSEFDVKHLIDYQFLKPLSYPVLRAIPERFGGGERAVDAANASPNREPMLFWTVIASALFLMVLIICAACCCGCCCGCCSKSKHTTIAKDKFAQHQKKGRIIYAILVVFAILIVLASICSLAFYFGTIGFAFGATEQQPTNGTGESIFLLDGIQTSINEIQSFVKEGITTFSVSVNASLTDFMDKVSVKVSDTVPKMVDNLLIKLNLLSFRDNGTAVVNFTSILLTNAKKVVQDIDGLKLELTNLETKMTESNNHFKTAFAKIPSCASDQDCLKLKTVAENLALPFNSSQMDTGNFQVVVGQLENLGEELSNVVDSYSDALGICNEMAENFSSGLTEKIDVGQIKQMAEDFASTLDLKVNDALSGVKAFINPVSPQIVQYKDWVIVALYSIGGLISLLVFIAIITIIRLTHLAWSGRIFSDQNDFEIPGNKCDGVITGKGSAWCCSLSLLLFLFIASILISVLLLVLTIVAGEGCIYVIEDDAMKKTDVVLNGFISPRWDSIIASANTEFLSKAPPNDILQALANTCQHSSVGLFAACKIESLLNRTAVVRRPEIQQVILKGEDLLLNEIKRMNLNLIVPGQAEINQLKTGLEAVFNQFNGSFTNLLQYIDSSQVDGAVIESLISDLNAFINTTLVTQKDDFISGLQALEEVKSSMSALKMSLSEVRTSVQSTAADVAHLESLISHLFDSFAESLNAVLNDTILTSETISQYKDFVAQLNVFLETDDLHVFNHLTQELFPCQSAHRAYRVAAAVTCGPSGAINSLIGFILISALTMLFLALLYVALFSLASYQAKQVRLLKTYIQYNSNRNIENNAVIDSIIH